MTAISGNARRFYMGRRARAVAMGIAVGAGAGVSLGGVVEPTYMVLNNAPSGSGSLAMAMLQAQSDSSAVINITPGVGTITLGAALPTIQGSLTINGNGATISGANSYRIFFVNAAGDGVQLNGLTLSGGFAQGGTGGTGNGGGGGGAGLGGAIFLNAGNLTVSDVEFSGNSVRGGNGGFGGGNLGSGGGGGGGGGLVTNGGEGGSGSENNGETFQGPGGGGGALTSAGADGDPNASRAGMGGGVHGGIGGQLTFSGSAPAGASPTLADGGGGGGGLTVDTGSGAGGNGGNGSDFGGGGGAGSSLGGNSGLGGNGGFGSGGGGGAQSGGYGGPGGIGGFGGGGGGGGITDNPLAGFRNGLGGQSGFGGGAGMSPGVGGAVESYGGGGLGAGGAVFARLGSTLLIQDSSFSGDSVNGGGGGNSGLSDGQAIFLGTQVNYSVSAGTITLGESLGGGNDPNALGGLTKSGAGTLAVTAEQSYIGATTVSGGTLELVNNVLQSTAVSISSGAVLQFSDTGNTDPTPITFSGAGTLRSSGSGDLIFGAFGTINVDLSPGGLIDVEGGTLTGSSSYGGNWTANQGSLNIASGAVFNAVEAGTTGTMQVDALTGGGSFLGGYSGNSQGGLSTVTIGVAGGSGTFSGILENNPSARLGIVKAGSGSETFTGANTYTGGTVVNDGILIIGANGALPDNSLSITGGTLQLGAGTGLASVTSLSVTGSGALDVTNNHLIVSYGASDPVATIYDDLKSGYNGGAWNGPGIDSSIAGLPANNAHYGVGFVDGKDNVPGADSAPGVPLTSGQILIAYALYGDVNLDGLVNATDFAIFGANFNKSVTGWDHGDFTYSGLVNGSDFALLGENFGRSASGTAINLPADDYAALDAFAGVNGLALPSVPEPASMSVVVLGTAMLYGRRRRKRLFA